MTLWNKVLWIEKRFFVQMSHISDIFHLLDVVTYNAIPLNVDEFYSPMNTFLNFRLGLAVQIWLNFFPLIPYSIYKFFNLFTICNNNL